MRKVARGRADGAGVSSRRYARSLEPLPEEIEVRGVSKSAVTERFVVGTAKLAELMRRKLGGLKLIAGMINGVRFADHVVLAAIGVDIGGKKHMLGPARGRDRERRRLQGAFGRLDRTETAHRRLLFVIDGAMALRKAIADTFGARALIQRCRQHKNRNVSDALPERMRSSVRSAMSQAYASGDPKHARQLLENLARNLERGYPGAAASLREGLEATLSVMRLDLPESLERVGSRPNDNAQTGVGRYRPEHRAVRSARRDSIGGVLSWLA